MAVPTREEYIAAANKAPSKRTASEQALVDRGSNIQAVRNADFEAKKTEKTGR